MISKTVRCAYASDVTGKIYDTQEAAEEAERQRLYLDAFSTMYKAYESEIHAIADKYSAAMEKNLEMLRRLNTPESDMIRPFIMYLAVAKNLKEKNSHESC